MAITRTTINGDLTALKDALSTLVPDFFGSVQINDNTITCRDDDENTIFSFDKNGNTRTWTAYKSLLANVYVSGSTTDYDAKYFYTVGTNGAVVELGFNHFLIIAKTNDDKTGIVIPNIIYSGHQFKCDSACWGDDVSSDGSVLTITDSSAPLTGNHCLFVPVPLLGTYSAANYFQKAFFLPMAQPNMRSAVQQITGASGIYMTNGFLALLDDSAAEETEAENG